MSGAELICTAVSAAPGGAPALRGVSLTVPAGSRLALVGPSGAGKTTMLRAIAGLQATDGGEILLDGRPLHRRGGEPRQLAMVFQEPRLLPHLTALDNVALPLRAAGVARKERRAAAAQSLADVGLEEFAVRRIQGLSGGEQQRVALARALCARPRLLLLDEPFAALDPERRSDVRQLVVSIQRQRELTTILVTHDRSEAAEIGDTIAFMHAGRVIQHGDPADLFERPASLEVARFFGATNLIETPDGPMTIRPEHVQITPHGTLTALVVAATYIGEHVRVTLQHDGAAITALVAPDASPVAGTTVQFELPAQQLWRLPEPATELAAQTGHGHPVASPTMVPIESP